MNIYDEAIKDVEEVIHIEGTCSKFIRIRKSLIYAKKEHELLELYKQQKKDREENSLSSTTLYWVIEKEISIKEKELEEMK